MRRIIGGLLLLLLLLFLVGCGPAAPPPPTPERPLRVLASTYPLQQFAARIAGEHAQVSCPVPAGADPASWMPDAATIQQLQQADLIILNGAGFETWPAKVSLPDSRVVDSSVPLKSTLIRYANTILHSHGPEGEHAHEGLDGHTWLDPQNGKLQAAQIHAALSRSRPARADTFAANFAGLGAELDALDAGFRALQLPPLLASHPAYNYLARRYGWNIHNLDLDPATMPSTAVIAQIRSILATHPARHLLWESPPSAEIATRLKTELGLSSLVFSPCETQPDGQDYLSIMRQNLKALAGTTN